MIEEIGILKRQSKIEGRLLNPLEQKLNLRLLWVESASAEVMTDRLEN